MHIHDLRGKLVLAAHVPPATTGPELHALAPGIHTIEVRGQQGPIHGALWMKN